MKEQELFKTLQQQIREDGGRYLNFKDEDIFTLWFLRAYLTEDEYTAAKSVVNGAKDKGIDGIYIDDKAKAVFLIQAKYRKQLHKIAEKANDVKQFAELSKILGDSDHTAFKTLIEEADDLVRDRLIEVRRKLEKKNYKLWLYYATLGKCTPTVRKEAESIVKHSGNNSSIEILDGKRLMLLYDDYLDGVAPPIPTLDLEIEKGANISVNGIMQRYDKGGEIESWAFPMRGSDIGALYDVSGIRLFARNIRGFLGKSTKVNSSMQATLENEPDKFFYYNNGITIICDHAKKESEKGKDILRVSNPQIINGQQTTRTLAMLPAKANSASVLVKVIQVPRNIQEQQNGFESLISAIVQGTNWQNPVKQSDLVVNDRKQIEIEREFRKLGYLYLRKRQSKSEAKKAVNAKYLRTVTKEDVARAVAGCEMDPRVMRLGLENLFSEKEYGNVFPNTDPNYYIPRYWLMYHVSRLAHGHKEGGYSKWLVLNFMWSRIQPIIGGNKKAVVFRRFCEKKDESVTRNLQNAINKVFSAVRKYYSKNKGTVLFLDFFKIKGRDKEFQQFWNSRANEVAKKFDKLLKSIEKVMLEN